MTPRLLATLALAPTLLLGGCSLPPVTPAPTVYDLGPAPSAPAGSGGRLAWRIADVTAPPWLSEEGIAYRLAYQQAQRQQHYRDSIWAAPPPALLTQRLRERLVTPASCPARPAALLAVNLDEFEQVFSSPDASHVVLRLHATFWPASATGSTLQQHWRLQRPAPTADAAGAARGLAEAVDELMPQLADWLAAAACR
ncbi:MAG: ABC-type transport auxiliary lipoprotein family protein [Roseateles sp.]|jgi:cholesterol transport system auxiliary component|nr:ABC transporter [Methylibium sp.]